MLYKFVRGCFMLRICSYPCSVPSLCKRTELPTKIKHGLAPRHSPVRQRLMELSAFGVNTAAR